MPARQNRCCGAWLYLMPLPPLYALRAFEAAARTASFTRAGEELHLTPSAISRHIRTLEAQLNRTLFSRNGPRVALTAEGQLLARELSAGFRTIERACARMQQRSDGLRLKAPTSLTTRWLLAALQAHRPALPQERVLLHSQWMDVDHVDFASEPYDCAVLLGQFRQHPQWHSIKLMDEWLLPVCSPAVAAQLGLELGLKSAPEALDALEAPGTSSTSGATDASPTAPTQDQSMAQAAHLLQQLPHTVVIHPSPDRRDWRRWCEGLGLQMDLDAPNALVFDTLEQGMAAATQGHGISMADWALAAEALRSGQLVAAAPTAVPTGDGYYLVWPRGSVHDGAIRGLGRWLRGRVPKVGVERKNGNESVAGYPTSGIK